MDFNNLTSDGHTLNGTVSGIDGCLHNPPVFDDTGKITDNSDYLHSFGLQSPLALIASIVKTNVNNMK